MWASAAKSGPLGTTLPRDGFFPGVRAPRYNVIVINGELTGTSVNSETTVGDWLEPYAWRPIQTSPVPQRARQLLTETWPTADTAIVRSTEAAHAYAADRADGTGSPWQEVRRTLAPLRATTDALLEDIRETLEHSRELASRGRHAGLAAVARLIDVLGLTRPTILRMGGVPSSTFYAWQKSPHSIIRTPTVTRLLQLQAQVAILDEAFGRERMRAWMLSPERIGRLEGDDAAFAEVIAEAGAALETTVTIQPRPRMRPADYSSGPESEVRSVHISPIWPGATKIPAENDKLEYKGLRY
jgi:hypothetical protein